MEQSRRRFSQINTQSYSGSECGSPYHGVLDHTGQDIYAQLAGAVATGSAVACDALQSFKISSTGALSFLGATEYENDGFFNPSQPTTPIALTGSGSYAYSFQYGYDAEVQTYAFQRESSGAMMSDDPRHVTNPTDPSGNIFYSPGALGVTGDPTNHLAIADNPYIDGEELNLPQLASYTVASNGDIASTNTSDNVPTPEVDPDVLNMSPSGQFVAVAGSSGTQQYQNGTQSNGLQVFYFNGANPITSYSGVLTTAPINEIHWDNSNHLYALSNSTKKLYVYTVTSSGITAVPGSPFTIASTPNALVVVPTSTACSAPSSAGVHICAPASGSSVTSPVYVQATATITGTISNMQLWVDGVKKYTTSGTNALNTSVSVAAGTHRFAVLAINTAGQKWESAVSATVK